ncbi:MAG: hypothetical protein LW720_10430 [Pirellula sp.]|jgi:hypothetical protein|nr:hypothetical protein [Pirellula sp.]
MSTTTGFLSVSATIREDFQVSKPNKALGNGWKSIHEDIRFANPMLQLERRVDARRTAHEDFV